MDLARRVLVGILPMGHMAIGCGPLIITAVIMVLVQEYLILFPGSAIITMDTLIPNPQML